MSNANLQILTTANSFLDWLTVTNNEANNDNTLRNGNYYKDGGSFYIGAGILSIITPTGTTLQVQANASIANLLTVGQLSVLGNIAVGNLAVTQNSTSGNLVVAQNTTTGNLAVLGNIATFANSVTITANLTAGNAVFANANVSGTLNVGTLSLGSGLNVQSLNVSGSISNAHDILVTANTTSGNIKAVQNVATGNLSVTQNTSTGNLSVTQNIATGNITATQNAAFGNGNFTQNVATGNISNLQNTSTGNISISQNVSSVGNVIVTQNVTSGNVVASALVQGASVTATGTVQGSQVTATTQVNTPEVVFTTGTGATIAGAVTTYGSIVVSSTAGGYAGIQFDGIANNPTFMMASGGVTSGLYNVTGGQWEWLFDTNVLYGVGQGPIALATGSTVVTTPSAGDNSTKIATTAFVKGSGSDPGSSIAASGYQKFVSGLILQWGSFAYGGSSYSVSFPLAFPTAAFSCVISQPDDVSYGYALPIDSLTRTGFSGNSPGVAMTLYYIAVGH